MIKGFQDEYRWLSNFHLVVVRLYGHKYPSVENAYQAAKTLDIDAREQFIYCGPSKAKQLGKTLQLRDDWDQLKMVVMLNLLQQKFSNTDLKTKLKNTGDMYIEETNTWGDTFWGVCSGIGENNLGKLIMRIRSKL